jgi:hypothetical protein
MAILALGIAYVVSLVGIVAFALAPARVELEVTSTDVAAPISGWIASSMDAREEYQGRTDPVSVRLNVSDLSGRFFTSEDQSLVLNGTVRKAGVTLARVHASGPELSISGGRGRISVGTGLPKGSLNRP